MPTPQDPSAPDVVAFGEGSTLWVVDVVLRSGDRDEAQAVVGEVLRRLPASQTPEEPRDVSVTYSYDMEPPDGSIGISLWVRADSVGDAANLGLSVVDEAATAVTGVQRTLWDLRLLPSFAILDGRS